MHPASASRVILPHPRRQLRKDTRTGQVELIEKDRREIKVKKMTPAKKGGPGVRLGVAYQLPDGSVVYVPESADAAKPSPVR